MFPEWQSVSSYRDCYGLLKYCTNVSKLFSLQCKIATIVICNSLNAFLTVDQTFFFTNASTHHSQAVRGRVFFCEWLLKIHFLQSPLLLQNPFLNTGTQQPNCSLSSSPFYMYFLFQFDFSKSISNYLDLILSNLTKTIHMDI